MPELRDDHTGALLATVAGYGLPGTRLELPATALTAEPWERLLQGAIDQRVAGHLLRAVDDDALPTRPEQLIQAFHAGRVERERTQRVDDALLSVADLFDAAGIDWRVLKGAAHARLAYAEPGLRAYIDVDLLVPGDQVGAAIAELLAVGGARKFAEPRPGFDRRFSKGASVRLPSGVEVDIHRTLAPGPFGLTVDLDDLFATTSRFRLGDRWLPALGHEERLLHACFHAVLGDAEPRLTALRDVVQLQIGEGGVDAARVVEQAEAWRAEVVLATAVDVATRTFGVPPSDLVAWAATERFPRAQRRALAVYRGPRRTSAGMSLASLSVIPGFEAKAAYAWALLMPRRDERRRPNAERWRRGLRALGTLVRTRRSDVRRTH